MINIILAVCMYPVLFIMYFVQKAEGKTKMRTLFGVNFSKEWLTDAEREQLEAEYRRTMNRYLIILALLPIVTFFIPYFSISFTIWMIWTIAMIVMFMLPYCKGNKKMLALKKERCLPETVNEIIYAELKNAGMIRCVKWQHFALPCGISILLAVFAVTFFREYRLEIYGGIIVIFALCSLLFWGIAMYMDRMKTKIISSDSDINVNYTRACKKIHKDLWLSSSWLNNVFIVALLIAMTVEVTQNVISSYVILWSSIIYSVLEILLCMRAFRQYYNLSRKYEKYRDLEPNSDENHWIGGMFYFNPKDKRTMVEKRVGMGTTVNMATPAGKVWSIISALALLIIPISCIWVILLEFTPISLSVDNETLLARQLRTDYVIDTGTITEVTLENELPRSSKINGTGMDALLKGEFRNSIDGRIEMFLNPQNEYYLRIVSDETIYYLGGYDDAETQEVYQLLISE